MRYVLRPTGVPAPAVQWYPGPAGIARPRARMGREDRARASMRPRTIQPPPACGARLRTEQAALVTGPLPGRRALPTRRERRRWRRRCPSRLQQRLQQLGLGTWQHIRGHRCCNRHVDKAVVPQGSPH